MNRLTESITAVCSEQLLEEKWLVVPSLRVGYQWLDQVAWHGQAAVNVHVKTFISMALDLAAPIMAASQLTLASSRAGILLTDRIIREFSQNQLAYLGLAQPSVGLAETVLASINAIRLAGLAAPDLDRSCFEVSTKGDDLELLLQRYLELLEEEKLVDYAWVLVTAREQLQASTNERLRDVLLLLPDDLELSTLETRLLESFSSGQRISLAVDQPASGTGLDGTAATDLELCRWLTSTAEAPPPLHDKQVQIRRGVGEVNEIRGVLRHCLQHRVPWDDVELLHTDTDQYVSLVYEMISSLSGPGGEIGDELAVTFAEGIPCWYSRPGRALLGWIHWTSNDCQQSELVKMVKEGLLRFGEEEEGLDFVRLAQQVRGLGAGFGSKRFLPRIIGRQTALKNRLQQDGEPLPGGEEPMTPAMRTGLERDLRDLGLLEQLLVELLAVTPAVTASQQEVVLAARDYLDSLARSVSKLDRFAHQKLIDELNDMAHWLQRGGDESTIDIWDWLRMLPADARVMGSTPRPGCLHVDSVHRGGHSGRGTTFIVGLDDGRFPGSGIQDPLLLDSERGKLSPALPTAAKRREERLQAFAYLLARLRGRLFLSFSSQGVTDDREMFPSPVLLTLFRLLSGDPESDQQALLDALPAPESFAPTAARMSLDVAEWWMWRLTEEDQVTNLDDFVLDQFPHLVDGKRAQEQWHSADFTAYDGLVPEAAARLDPTAPDGPVMSANGLQKIGECPRAFFFKYGLDLSPPDETVVDPTCWLDALARGLLLHELFEVFVRELVAAKRFPEMARDRDRLLELLDEHVARYRDRYPPVNEMTFQQEFQEIRQTALTFLGEDERFCREHGCRPLYLEASLGLSPGEHGTPLDSDEPIPVMLAGGQTIRLRGRVDRVDVMGDVADQQYAVWDYKTGSSWGYDHARPFQQGRKVQPFLYLMMVRHVIQEQVDPSAEVKHFGFFFPGPKTVGARIGWTLEELSNGREVLEHLCRLVADGAFLATNNGQDCHYCDYLPICGHQAAGLAQLKLDNPENTVLEPLRQLRTSET